MPHTSYATENGSSSSQSATSAIIFPLAVAWAYLDALAKTWVAIGEKLHVSIYGGAKHSNSTNEQRQQQQHQQQQNQRREGQPHRAGVSVHQQGQRNRLEFSLTDFLRSKADCFGYRHFNTPHDDEDDASAPVAAAATTTTSWPRRLRGVGSSLRRTKVLLPASTRSRNTEKTLVLDLDETLIRARKDLSGERGDTGRFDFLVVLPPRPKPSVLGVDVGCTPSSHHHHHHHHHCNHAQHPHQPLQQAETLVSASASTATAASSRKCTRHHNPRIWTRGGDDGSSGGGSCSTQCGKGSSSGAGGSVAGRGESWGCNGAGGTVGGGGWRKVYVSKRPHLHEFLQAVSKEFEVVVFTAARAEFARAVVNEIDPTGEMIDHVLSRENCTRLSLSKRKRVAVVKDLGIIGRPLSKVRRVCMDWCSFA
ncbi:unnamed protein product, partial [Sphacelaria rigidula]